MRVAKGLFFFALVAGVTSCFNPPEYSTTPKIDYVGVCFKDGGTTDPDVLRLTVSFRDGDGDLGLSANQIEEPYNDIFYGLANSGEVVEAGKETVYSDLPQFIKVAPGTTGKLVTVRTLLDPAYSDDLPPYVDAISSCYDYKIQKVYIQEKDKAIIDASYPDIDTMTSSNFPPIYIVEDEFYYKRNPNHRNIEVEFWMNDGTGNFTLFDWEKAYCEAAFNQRFPELSDKSGPLEGQLNYDMSSVGIRGTFGSQTLRLKIRIRDRALNVSNEVVSQDFTLDAIRGSCE